MTLKRTISYIFILLIFFVLALFIVLASFSLLLPRALQSSLISEITTATGISDFSLHVREIDLDGADFGEVRFGDEAAPALIVSSIQVDYTPAGLAQKKIKQVTASGIELYLEFKEGKLGFRGVNLESLMQRLQSRWGGHRGFIERAIAAGIGTDGIKKCHRSYSRQRRDIHDLRSCGNIA